MSPYPSETQERAKLLRQALSRWDNEGGADVDQSVVPAGTATPPLTNAELVQLQIRVIALENLVLALLAGASDKDLALVQELGAAISPRPGVTAHRLTTHAVAQMEHMALRSRALKQTPLG